MRRLDGNSPPSQGGGHSQGIASGCGARARVTEMLADVAVAPTLFASADGSVRIAEHGTRAPGRALMPAKSPVAKVRTAKSRSKPKRPAPFLRLAYSAPEPDESIATEIRRFTLPATKALPFVKVRANDQPLWRPESFWNVVSTGKRENDVQLGRKYARLAIAAMKADRDSDLIARVIQDIIKDAIENMGKNGRGRNSPAAVGFLAEISEVIAARP
jgi:hypothetical protein